MARIYLIRIHSFHWFGGRCFRLFGTIPRGHVLSDDIGTPTGQLRRRKRRHTALGRRG
jgi:hypothetical protein